MRNSICLPAAPPVDITDYIPLIEHPLFQSLRGRKQLGINDLVFPGAQHTRFEHALGTLALTQRACTLHGFPEATRRLLEAFALLHDIGHGPFSHQLEPVLGRSHHQRGLECLEAMGEALAACGLAWTALQRMMTGEDPLAIWISDRNLGTDKLDYLRRDALHIGFAGVPDLERLQCCTSMTPDGLAIDSKFIEDAKRLQKFYSYLHQHGYLNKTAMTAQRMLQRAVHEALLADEMAPDALWAMEDRHLLNWLEASPSPLARRLTADLHARQLYRSVLTLKPRGYGFVENSAGKCLAVREMPLAELRRILQRLQDIWRLRQVEDELAARHGLPPGGLLIAAMPYYRKLIPKDVRISVGKQDGFWLLEKDTDHLRSLESDYQRTFAVRLLVPADKRAEIAGRADLLLADLSRETSVQ